MSATIAAISCASPVSGHDLPMRFILHCILLSALLSRAGAEVAFRAARSVHLGFPAPEGRLFHNEVVIDETVDGSYFMVCGWDTGYFGVQQLKGTNKVVIFSVWDKAVGDDPGVVKTEDRVEVLYQAPGVRIKRFGGEGTGGQCMAPFSWKVGETNRFLIGAVPEKGKTAYTAWVFDHSANDWKKLATFRTRTAGQGLRGYYSFLEDFRRDTKSVGEIRRARFGNGWVKTVKGDWMPLKTARFTASNAEWESKENVDAGSKGPWFWLATGGETKRSREVGSQVVLESPRETSPGVPAE